MKAPRDVPAILLALLLLSACGSGGELESTAGEQDGLGDAAVAEAVTAEAVIRNAQNDMVGMAQLTETPTGVRLAVQVSGLPAGEHGFHIHATGRCDPPDFASAGGHFNPTGKSHGLDSPEGAHLGDMRNLVVAADGTAETTRTIEGARLAGDEPQSLVRTGGTAIVIHEGPDDYLTDPSGNAGSRLACGVIVAG